jgi:hypothetical protein
MDRRQPPGRCAPQRTAALPPQRGAARRIPRAAEPVTPSCSHDPRAVADAAIRRLDDQLVRIRRLYEFGEYDWDASSPSGLRSNRSSSDYATRPPLRQPPPAPSGVAHSSWTCWLHGTLLTTGNARACSQDSSSPLRLRHFQARESSSLPSRAAHGNTFFRYWYPQLAGLASPSQPPD